MNTIAAPAILCLRAGHRMFIVLSEAMTGLRYHVTQELHAAVDNAVVELEYNCNEEQDDGHEYAGGNVGSGG